MKTKTVHVKLGMRRSYFAPITARPGTGHPTYGTVLDMGEAVLGHLAVTYATGDIFGDDASRLHLEQFISGQLDTETTCSELELAAAVYGRKFVDGVETSNKDDAAPDGGYGYIEPFLKADKTMVFRAVFLYNVTPMPSQEFQSTPPVWGETIKGLGSGLGDEEFQSTPPVWGETRPPEPDSRRGEFQSTPPVWGETYGISQMTSCAFDFNPLPPCGGRQARSARIFGHRKFQSTPPVGGET